MYILIILLNVLMLGLFLYSKLLPHKDRLNPRFASVFSFFHRLFSPLLGLLNKIIKPFEVGVGLSVDMTQVVLFMLIMLLVNVIR